MTKNKFDPSRHLPWVAALLILFAVFGGRYTVAGGDMGCFFAQDPALCVAVKGMSE